MEKRNVALTGFMGTGKSTVGRLLATLLDYQFVDTDDLIVVRDGRSIADIFHEDGEAAFRRWEAYVAQELAEQSRLVIATGGRMMLDPENAALLSDNSHVFCLTADPETIVTRLVDDGGKRPLLDVPHPIREIERLLEEREVGYGRFTQINTNGKTPSQIAAEIMQKMNKRGEKVMYFCDTENRVAKEVVPGIRLQTFWGEKMLLSVVELDAGAILPAHSHPHEQSGTIISGTLMLTIDGETRALMAGDAYIIPGGVEHSAVAGSTLTKVVDIFSPVREEYKF